MSAQANSKEYVPRISQLDSMLLSSEAYSIIKSQLLSAVKYVGQKFVTKLEPEIDAGLQYLILKYTVYKERSSVGQQLLQIKYEEATSLQKLHNYILTVVLGRWLKQRIGFITCIITKNDNAKAAVDQCVNWLEIVYKVLQIVNLLVFLQKGYYPTVTERLFGLRHTSANPGNVRRISYTYFTRELLWHGFAELLAFILPLINVQYFHSIVKKIVPSLSETHNNADEPGTEFSPRTTCVICNKLPVLPHSFGCRHLACYYCIYSSYSSDPLFSCLLCGHKIDNSVQILPTSS
ncbi:peroxisome biogenesis factor 2 [Procambarus clarkii]|uniref:peroxisome biogenesis factor 2 n=1 Tax=Procambarus clarkii TaxID=6728 RepID=UPI0037443128